MLDVEGEDVHDVGVVAAVVHQHHLVKDLGGTLVQDTPDRPQQGGERLCNIGDRYSTRKTRLLECSFISLFFKNPLEELMDIT